MKKITLFSVALSFALMATTQVMAQKIDQEAKTAELKKLDESIENPKKNIKGSTWLKHADGYYNSIKEPVKSLYVGSPMTAVTAIYGKARKSENVTIGSKQFKKHTYNYVIVYESAGNVSAWEPTREISKDAYKTAISSYVKAMEIEPGVKAKAEAGLDKVSNHFRELGNIYISLENYPKAADSYMMSNEALEVQGEEKSDPKMVYMAGYMYTIHGTRNHDKASCSKGEKYLRAALDSGYDEIEMADETVSAENKGLARTYVYHCVMGGEQELTQERLVELKDFIAGSVAMYPDNENLMSCLMALFSQHPEVGTPDEAIAMIDMGLEKTPDNLGLWYSRGRIYSTLKNYDECIKSFENVIRLQPEEFNGHFYVGVFYTSKADEFNDMMREKEYAKQADYNADYDILSGKYKEALPYLERAQEIKPEDKTVLEYLKSIYFRVRNDEGMMEKYNKYNELYNSVVGE